MSRRLSYAEKGKNQVALPPPPPPRQSRVKVPAFDNSKLIKKASLTLIGRITNPKIQRVWSLISFFTDHWKVSVKPVGADLGHGQFQFQFATEKDLQQVLDNRPYHFAYWMIILQRWEPTTASSFPSQIPFWIQIQGIPIHLWSNETLRSIADNIGQFQAMEITSTTAKIQVHIDGLQPLITSSMVEFENGDEAEATLIYEKLEKHCILCWSLLHDAKDFSLNPPKNEIQTREQRDHSTGKLREEVPWTNEDSHFSKTGSLAGPHHKSVPSRQLRDHRGQESCYSLPRNDRNHFTGSERERSRNSIRDSHYRGRDYNRPHPSDLRHSLDSSRSHHSSQSQYEGHVETNSHTTPRWVEKARPDPTIHERRSGDRPSFSESSRQRRPPLDRELSPHQSPEHLPREAFNTALNEVQDVMVQYSSCADPSESAARKERLRLAEENGQVEHAAAQMVRASLAAQSLAAELTSSIAPNPDLRSAERIPASQRLGPTDLPEET
ncbi:unnamed protein product [Microthlaspi erraticum]|uniref:DUF4283 domain-containing protein n=1 Tax=Microthlaspi erraticum TaxID=1685480 RepID=A0A6D2J0T7_9BRAS|nr:unnamed protein product [Microthlaspi erraticum]